MGHDEISLLYNHYCVTTSKCDVTFVTLGVGTATSTLQGVRLTAGTVMSDAYDALMERAQYNLKGDGKISYGINANNSASYSNTMMKRKLNYSAKSFFNVSDVKDNFDRLGASFANSPSEQAYFQVFVSPTDGATTGNVVRCTVRITYNVICSEPKNIGQS